MIIFKKFGKYYRAFENIKADIDKFEYLFEKTLKATRWKVIFLWTRATTKRISNGSSWKIQMRNDKVLKSDKDKNDIEKENDKMHVGSLRDISWKWWKKNE